MRGKFKAREKKPPLQEKGAHAMSGTVAELPGATDTRGNADAADFSQKKKQEGKNKCVLAATPKHAPVTKGRF